MALLIHALLAACECEASTAEQRIAQADVIFRGQLANLSENVEGCDDTGTWNFSFLVLEVYQGEVVERVNVQSDPPDAESCGIPVEREGELLVYATKLPNYREYESTICMGTKRIEEAEADLVLLGDGHDPGDVGCFALPLPSAVWLLLAALLLGLRRRRLTKPPRLL